MDYTIILRDIEQHVRDYYATHYDATLLYHDIKHTETVVSAAKEMAAHYRLDDESNFIVLTATWFHDIGYFINPKEHEKSGAGYAASYLSELHIPENVIAAVQSCIMATRLPQSPKNLLEEIVCDADLFHLGTQQFEERNKLMRKEAEACMGKKIGKAAWRCGTIELLQQHHYHTDYARQKLNPVKSKALEDLVAKSRSEATDEGEEKTEKKKKNKDSSKPERGIETMFRITSNNSQRLSDMADNKAQIMITVNSIILSAIISLLLRKIDGDNSHLAIPTYIILSVSLLTIIFAILATRPRLPKGTFTEKDIEERKVNLLFFGNFYKMSLKEYEKSMLQLMDDRDYLYGSLIKDVYNQGVVLGQKYKLLRISYNIFMFGLIVSVLAFIVATFLNL